MKISLNPVYAFTVIMQLVFFSYFIVLTPSMPSMIDGEKQIKVLELPDNSDFQLEDGRYWDIGYSFKQVEFLYTIPIWNYNEQLCAYIDNDLSLPLSHEELTTMAADAGLILPDKVALPFWDSTGGKLIFLFIVALFILFLNFLFRKKIISWYLRALTNLKFSGRARRKEFWSFLLIYTVITGILSIVDVTIIGLELLSYTFMAISGWPLVAVFIRRLHDTGRSGWWWPVFFLSNIGGVFSESLAETIGLWPSLFLFFVLFVCGTVIFIFSVQDGKSGANKYGEDPKELQI